MLSLYIDDHAEKAKKLQFTRRLISQRSKNRVDRARGMRILRVRISQSS